MKNTIPSIQTAPVEMSYPTLLPMPIPQIIAYSIETVIAEKFEAMIHLAAQNSRMKDFYDVFRLLKSGNYNADILQEAIANTFQRRETDFVENHVLFTVDFMENAKRQEDWKSFLKKINKEFMDFPSVIQLIVERLRPIYEKIKGGKIK